MANGIGLHDRECVKSLVVELVSLVCRVVLNIVKVGILSHFAEFENKPWLGMDGFRREKAFN